MHLGSARSMEHVQGSRDRSTRSTARSAAQISLVFALLTWGAYATGLLCSFAYPSPDSQPRSPRYAEGQYTVPVVLLAFLIGLQCCMSTLRLINTLSSALEAGIPTIFIGHGEDPQVLAVRAPALYGLDKRVCVADDLQLGHVR
ncbi:hypothetical protein BV22DRAFT_1135684 [Leucogyrophana mollusca]|uniref:Uncharacterized protein n=1 Tax=Leucogyrophana mollusca TaxID=85980 RepID=A0ACB8AXH1_9AGAM|nr:hypothetical protein BV22DRAFT_1135684 [Leucogyrophana mollusca]